MTLRWLQALAGFLLLLAAGCREPEKNAETAAREFFETVGQGHAAEAYRSASFAFRALQSEGAFAVTSRDVGLVGARLESLSPHAAETNDRTAKLEAVVVPAEGAPQAFSVTMLRESGVWRVFSLRTPRSLQSGVSENRFSPLGKTLAFSDAGNHAPPDDRSVQRLVRETMADFAEAVAQRSFTNFYSHVSKAWQAQLTERQLEKAFQGFITQEVNLSGVADLGAVLDQPPMVSTEGLLIVSGHYPTKPYEVIFSFKFVYETPDWKLFGLDVNLRQAEE